MNTQEFIDLLKNNDIYLYEPMIGDTIFIEKTNDTFNIIPNHIYNSIINRDDSSIYDYYKYVFDTLDSLQQSIIDNIDNNTFFECKYTKDNLCLISVNNKSDYKTITEYSDLLNIKTFNIIYNGRLNESQINSIFYFITTCSDDLEILFNNLTLTDFIKQLLCNDCILKDNEICLNADNNIIDLKNPIKNDIELYTNYTDIISVIILDFVEFLATINLDKNSSYLETICDLFNMYIENRKGKVQYFDFTIPPVTDESLSIIKNSISNKETVFYIQSLDKYDFIFNTIYKFFKSEISKPFGLVNNTTLHIINNFIKTCSS